MQHHTCDMILTRPHYAQNVREYNCSSIFHIGHPDTARHKPRQLPKAHQSEYEHRRLSLQKQLVVSTPAAITPASIPHGAPHIFAAQLFCMVLPQLLQASMLVIGQVKLNMPPVAYGVTRLCAQRAPRASPKQQAPHPVLQHAPAAHMPPLILCKLHITQQTVHLVRLELI